MKYLKTFELFDFFKKKESPEPKTPLERLKWIFPNYKNFKKDKNVYSFSVEDKMERWYISYLSKTSNFAFFIEKSKKEDKYYIIPFEGTKMGDGIDITKSEFEEYSRKLEEIDEFLHGAAVDRAGHVIHKLHLGLLGPGAFALGLSFHGLALEHGQHVEETIVAAVCVYICVCV